MNVKQRLNLTVAVVRCLMLQCVYTIQPAVQRMYNCCLVYTGFKLNEFSPFLKAAFNLPALPAGSLRCCRCGGALRSYDITNLISFSLTSFHLTEYAHIGRSRDELGRFAAIQFRGNEAS